MKPFREGKRLLFISKPKKNSDISKNTITGWVTMLLYLVHSNYNKDLAALSGRSTHDIWTMAASSVFSGQVELGEIGIALGRATPPFRVLPLRHDSGEGRPSLPGSSGSCPEAGSTLSVAEVVLIHLFRAALQPKFWSGLTELKCLTCETHWLGLHASLVDPGEGFWLPTSTAWSVRQKVSAHKNIFVT